MSSWSHLQVCILDFLRNHKIRFPPDNKPTERKNDYFSCSICSNLMTRSLGTLVQVVRRRIYPMCNLLLQTQHVTWLPSLLWTSDTTSSGHWLQYGGRKWSRHFQIKTTNCKYRKPTHQLTTCALDGLIWLCLSENTSIDSMTYYDTQIGSRQRGWKNHAAVNTSALMGDIFSRCVKIAITGRPIQVLRVLRAICMLNIGKYICVHFHEFTSAVCFCRCAFNLKALWPFKAQTTGF